MTAWAGSTRRNRLPGNWRTLRTQVLERDGHQCVAIINGQRCTAEATDVDHIIPSGSDALENLQSMCHPHHVQKTNREKAHARWSRADSHARRPPEQHPGIRR